MTTQETRDDIEAVLVGLVSLDLEIRRSQGGNPGSGLYMLLDLLAGQFLGVPRGTYPAAPAGPFAPINVDIPALQPFGPVTAGTVVSVTMGNWEGEPITYAYLWQRDGENIDGAADANAYTTQEADVDRAITCIVTAENETGATAAPPSNAVMVIAA